VTEDAGLFDAGPSSVIALDEALLRAGMSMVGSLALFIGIAAIPAVGEHTPFAILFGGVFVVPFYYVGYFIARVLEEYTENSRKLYGADLLGSAIGAIAVVFLLDRAPPQVVF
jgi:hypothetical protein